MMLCNLAAGGAAGASSITVTYPLDMARTRLATDIGSVKSSQSSVVVSRQFTGTFDCLSHIYRTVRFVTIMFPLNTIKTICYVV